MAKDGPLAGKDILVQEAQRKWGDLYVRDKKSFELFLKLFQKPLDFTAIGKRVSLTSSRVGQIYETYFREIFDNKSGVERYQEICDARRRARIQKREDRFLRKNPVVTRIIERVSPLGYTIHGVTHSKHSDILCSRKLVINNKRCTLYTIRSVFKTPKGKSLYAATQFQRSSLSETDILIFYICPPAFPEHFYILPATVLEEKIQNAVIHLYFPLGMQILNRQAPRRIEYRQHREAWHLLGH